MPGIKFWTDGLETVDESDERPLTGAERAELERKEHLSKWPKLVERVACAAAALSGFIGFLADDRVLRLGCAWASLACLGLAWAASFVAKRRA